MQYNKISADVLNEADRFERIMNWQLFCAQQEAMLWDYAGTSESKWHPGMPIHKHPIYRDFRWENGLEWDEYLAFGDGADGNHIRPMVELLEDGERYWKMLCPDCEVSWVPENRFVKQPCWMCGEERGGMLSNLGLTTVEAEPIGRVVSSVRNLEGYSVTMQMTARVSEGFWTALFGDVGLSIRSMEQAFRGVSSSFSVVDENMRYFQNMWINPFPVEPYEYQPAQTPFHIPEHSIQLPEPAIAEFIPESEWRGAWGQPRRHRGRRVVLPAMFDRFGRVVPEMPRMADLNIDYSQYDYRPAYVELTRERRNR